MMYIRTFLYASSFVYSFVGIRFFCCCCCSIQFRSFHIAVAFVRLLMFNIGSIYTIHIVRCAHCAHCAHCVSHLIQINNSLNRVALGFGYFLRNSHSTMYSDMFIWCVWGNTKNCRKCYPQCHRKIQHKTLYRCFIQANVSPNAHIYSN